MNCPLATRFCSFQPLHRLLSPSWNDTVLLFQLISYSAGDKSQIRVPHCFWRSANLIIWCKWHNIIMSCCRPISVVITKKMWFVFVLVCSWIRGWCKSAWRRLDRTVTWVRIFRQLATSSSCMNASPKIWRSFMARCRLMLYILNFIHHTWWQEACKSTKNNTIREKKTNKHDPSQLRQAPLSSSARCLTFCSNFLTYCWYFLWFHGVGLEVGSHSTIPL